MCVNSLNTKTVCRNAVKNLAVLDFCINTQTYTHNSNYIKITTDFLPVVMTVGRN